MSNLYLHIGDNQGVGQAPGLPKPPWLKPEMIFTKGCVEVKGFLGCGEFGMVQKAVVRYGPAA